MFSQIGIHNVESITIEPIHTQKSGCHTRMIRIKADGGMFDLCCFSYKAGALDLIQAEPIAMEVVK